MAGRKIIFAYVNVDGDGNRKRGRSCFGGFIFISSPAQSDFRVGLAMSGMGLNFTRSMMMMMMMVMTMINIARIANAVQCHN